MIYKFINFSTYLDKIYWCQHTEHQQQLLIKEAVTTAHQRSSWRRSE